LSADDAMELNEGKLEGESVTMKIVPLHIITLSIIENPTGVAQYAILSVILQ
jgi:hypothetical protein